MDIAMIRRAGKKLPDLTNQAFSGTTTVRDLNPSLRAFKAIRRIMGILELQTVWEMKITAICKYSADDFLGLKNCGHSTLNEIRRKLKPFGLFLKNDKEGF